MLFCGHGPIGNGLDTIGPQGPDIQSQDLSILQICGSLVLFSYIHACKWVSSSGIEYAIFVWIYDQLIMVMILVLFGRFVEAANWEPKLR